MLSVLRWCGRQPLENRFTLSCLFIVAVIGFCKILIWHLPNSVYELITATACIIAI